eukprot:TRINITY_DN29794_c0_g1_i1.p1 TRINITY_DN29794_c0_g1~~TRINITY_DN29794_c0_g1_i1.p1  ORF type:complete len:384 (+),score=58.74 TRINITY_DN29794_c0_g1_i1:130-1281(+)
MRVRKPVRGPTQWEEVCASEKALELECSLSPELSQLLSGAGGALALQLHEAGCGTAPAEKNKEKESAPSSPPGSARKAASNSEQARIVSYLPVSPTGFPKRVRTMSIGSHQRSRVPTMSIGSVRGFRVPSLGGASLAEAAERVLTLQSRISGWEADDEVPLAMPQLEFDPKFVEEYVSSPTKFESGAVWLDGTARPCEMIAWAPNSFREMKAPPQPTPRFDKEGQGENDQSESSSRVNSEIQIRVVDILPTEEAELLARGAEKRSKRPNSAQGLRRNRPSSAGTRHQVSTAHVQSQSGGRHNVSAGPVPPSQAMKEVSGKRWGQASIESKRQLLRVAAYSPGEVSTFIHEVQRNRGGAGSIAMGMSPGSKVGGRTRLHSTVLR